MTGKFGHPYGYGFLHEVREHTTVGLCLTLTLTQKRTLTTPEMAASMPSLSKTARSSTALSFRSPRHITFLSMAPTSASSFSTPLSQRLCQLR